MSVLQATYITIKLFYTKLFRTIVILYDNFKLFAILTKVAILFLCPESLEIQGLSAFPHPISRRKILNRGSLGSGFLLL